MRKIDQENARTKARLFRARVRRLKARRAKIRAIQTDIWSLIESGYVDSASRYHENLHLTVQERRQVNYPGLIRLGREKNLIRSGRYR